MNIVFVTTEVYPFQKHGGLADISASLPKTLKGRKHNITTILPYYEDDPYQSKYMLFKRQDITLGDHTEPTEFYTYTYHDVPYIFIKNSLFNAMDPKEDVIRYLIFNKAVLEVLQSVTHPVDIIHINDWQTSFIPFLLDSMYRKDTFYTSIKTLLTIHNIERQGIFDRSHERYLPYKNFTYILHGQLNFLKTGIMRAHWINTVSETYKQEILLRFYGFDLDSALKSRQDHLTGILNGFDHELYDPTTQDHLSINYDIDTYQEGKRKNKEALLRSLQLNVDLEKPLLLFIGRLGRQKGIDLMKDKLDHVVANNDAALVIIGEGEPKYEAYFRELEKQFPKQVFFHHGFDQALSQRAYAAGDFFLLPSLFEPCGLNHMIAMRYGTLPIVRATGGLKDTVFNEGPDQNGYTFKNFDQKEFELAFDQAIKDYHEQSTNFNQKIIHAMHVTSYLDEMALKYEIMYQRILDI
ncbi:MAG: glycogen synthase [Acholeplasmataceae bacterium]